MTGTEVRALKDEEISTELSRLRGKIFGLKNKSVSEKIEDISQFSKIRKDIARLLTEQTARASA
ncbi:MAG: 50S ribosomal protein L29 [Phycisphaerales bacterium]|nr:50S ribosomal protein L29 [Phycisphaerales bacterium]